LNDAERAEIEGHSPRTRKAYLHHINRHLHHFIQTPDELCEEGIKGYLLHLIEKEKVSRVYYGQAVSL